MALEEMCEGMKYDMIFKVQMQAWDDQIKAILQELTTRVDVLEQQVEVLDETLAGARGMQ